MVGCFLMERSLMFERLYNYMLNYPIRLYEPLLIVIFLWLSRIAIKVIKSKKVDYIAEKIPLSHWDAKGFERLEQVGLLEYKYRLVFTYIEFVCCWIVAILYCLIIFVKCYSFIK